MDSTQYGMPPQPWDIPVEYPPLFNEGEVKIPVPHTESVDQCEECYGRGRVKCHDCDGVGRTQCYRCLGRGRVTVNNGETTREERCPVCQGNGRVNCRNCYGDGMEKCDECKGHGRVVKYVQVDVIFIVLSLVKG